jgi:hypothetical protein
MKSFIIIFSLPHIIIMNEMSFWNTVGELENIYWERCVYFVFYYDRQTHDYITKLQARPAQ